VYICVSTVYFSSIAYTHQWRGKDLLPCQDMQPAPPTYTRSTHHNQRNMQRTWLV